MTESRLNRRKIVSAAIDIADESGIGAVSLRGIAARLGVHVTSLYNHVPTKEAVMDELVDALISEARLPAGTLTWQDWVRQFANALRALARQHPGAFEAFHHRQARGPHAAETFESALAAFQSAGFDPVSSYSAIKATIVAVLGLVLEDTAGIRHPGLRTDLQQLPVERFPHIHEMGRAVDKADPFSYLVETLIAGFEAQKRRAKSGSRSGRT